MEREREGGRERESERGTRVGDWLGRRPCRLRGPGAAPKARKLQRVELERKRRRQSRAGGRERERDDCCTLLELAGRFASRF
jgi:hypothetical protein